MVVGGQDLAPRAGLSKARDIQKVSSGNSMAEDGLERGQGDQAGGECKHVGLMGHIGKGRKGFETSL